MNNSSSKIELCGTPYSVSCLKLKQCEAFNKYFSSVVASLNIPNVNNYITAKENTNKCPQQIKCFETHPSITRMKWWKLSAISQLNTPKTYQNADTPTKITKVNKDILQNLSVTTFKAKIKN